MNPTKRPKSIPEGFCEKHKPEGGARNCVVCGLEQLSFALSRISYLRGEPNEMGVSEYSTHYDHEAVVKQVEKLKEEHVAMCEPRPYDCFWSRRALAAEKRVAELETDKKRLDWLQENVFVMESWIIDKESGATNFNLRFRDSYKESELVRVVIDNHIQKTTAP